MGAGRPRPAARYASAHDTVCKVGAWFGSRPGAGRKCSETQWYLLIFWRLGSTVAPWRTGAPPARLGSFREVVTG